MYFRIKSILMSGLIISLIALASGIAAFISSAGKIYDDRKKGLNKITKRGRLYVFFTFILIVLPVLQSYLQDKADKVKEIKAKELQDKRDSIQKAHHDSSILASNEHTISILSDNLGKYGYQFDSANQKLIKLVRDSSKTRVIVPENPSLILSLIPNDRGIQFVKNENGFNVYKIVFHSKNASSSYFKLMGSILLQDSLKNIKYNYKQEELIPFNYIVAKDDFVESFIGIEDTTSFQYLYIWIKGDYQPIEGNKKLYFDNVYYYNTKGGTFGIIKGETRNQVIELCKLYE